MYTQTFFLRFGLVFNSTSDIATVSTKPMLQPVQRRRLRKIQPPSGKKAWMSFSLTVRAHNQEWSPTCFTAGRWGGGGVLSLSTKGSLPSSSYVPAWPALGQLHLLLRSGPFAVPTDKELSKLFRFAVGWQHMSCWPTSERTNYIYCLMGRSDSFEAMTKPPFLCPIRSCTSLNLSAIYFREMQTLLHMVLKVIIQYQVDFFKTSSFCTAL